MSTSPNVNYRHPSSFSSRHKTRESAPASVSASASLEGEISNDAAIARAIAGLSEDSELKHELDLDDNSVTGSESEFQPSDEEHTDKEEEEKKNRNDSNKENFCVNVNGTTPTPILPTPTGNVIKSKLTPRRRGKGKKHKLASGEDETLDERKRFSKEEDLLLIESYFSVSEDSAVGTNQTSNTMWDRITQIIANGLTKLPIGNRILRSPTSYKSRYHTIQTDTVKLLSYCNQCSASGDNQVTINEKAHALFEASRPGNSKFSFDHCVDLMQSSEKIRSLVWSSSASRPDRSTSSNLSLEDTNSLISPRPQGRDSTKRNRAAERERKRSKVEPVQSKHMEAVADSMASMLSHFNAFNEGMKSLAASASAEWKVHALLGQMKLFSKHDKRWQELMEELDALRKL